MVSLPQEDLRVCNGDTTGYPLHAIYHIRILGTQRAGLNVLFQPWIGDELFCGTGQAIRVFACKCQPPGSPDSALEDTMNVV